ncbi:MAG: hypothetical protein ACREBR_05740 [bacterium]
MFRNKQFCSKGHNTFLYGRDKQHHCKICKHERIKKYYEKNKDKILEHDRIYQIKRYKDNSLFRLKRAVRSRLKQATKYGYKTGSAVKDLGCSIEFFKQYIESKFYSNMSWSNWGEAWELDHIKPLNKFNLTKREELLEAVNYMNFQPLTIEDHKNKTRGDNNGNTQKPN